MKIAASKIQNQTRPEREVSWNGEKKLGLKNLVAGDHLLFGTYPQKTQKKDGIDCTPIEWIVLEISGRQAFLLSRYALDVQPYNKKVKDTTWEVCSLRKWLNNTFFNKAFSKFEKKAIILCEVDNSREQRYTKWSTNGGNNTRDNVFLLSYAEANKYLGVTFEKAHSVFSGYDETGSSRAVTSITAYAVKAGTRANDYNKNPEGEIPCSWWLRSPGGVQDSAGCVSCGGSLLSYRVDGGFACVRPALWVNLESWCIGINEASNERQ